MTRPHTTGQAAITSQKEQLYRARNEMNLWSNSYLLVLEQLAMQLINSQNININSLSLLRPVWDSLSPHHLIQPRPERDTQPDIC